MNLNDPRTQHKLARIKQLLQAKDLDLRQIAEAVPMSTRYTREYMMHMVDQQLAHIVNWTRYDQHGMHIGVFRLGEGKNAPYPAPLTNMQKKRRYHARLKAEPERWERHLKGAAARKRKPPKQHPLVAAMFRPTREEN